MTTPQCERHPGPPEVPSTGIANRQAIESTLDGTAYAGPMSEDTENYWTDRREHFMQWLPCARRPELEARALREFDRAESAAFCVANERRVAELLAQREASLAISAAVDWTRQSTVASFQELQRRRSVIT